MKNVNSGWAILLNWIRQIGEIMRHWIRRIREAIRRDWSKKRIAQGALALLAVGLVVLMLLFDWNWLRGPIERYVTRKTGRQFTIAGNIDGSVFPLTLRLRQVRFENASWSQDRQMASIEELEFRPHFWRLVNGELVVDKVRVLSPDVLLERTRDAKRNWVFGQSDDPDAKAPRITSLAVDRGIIRVRDAVKELDALVQVRTDPQSTGPDAVLPTRIEFSGNYLKVPFNGVARIGDLLALHAAGKPYPLRGNATFAETHVEVDGTFADILRLDGLDAQVKLVGPDWSKLFPVIPVALPRSPPYALDGHMKNDGDRYAYEPFNGHIGKSDISGSAIYTEGAATRRPHLGADFHSTLLDFKDLGPMIGLNSTSPEAASSRRAGKVLPDEPFSVERLNVMDADVTLRARQIRRSQGLALEDMNARLKLVAGVLTLDPLDFGFAGGNIVSLIRLNARQDPIVSQANISLRAVKLEELFPTIDLMKESHGLVGAVIKLSGRGNSVARMLANAEGEAGFANSGGALSNLLIEFVGLDGGEIVKFLTKGDRETAIRCGGALFDVKDGIGTTRSFVFDTVDTRIDGFGVIDFKDETVDLHLKPHPKDKSIFVLRSPLRVSGPFSNPSFSVQKKGLLKRAGAAVLLGMLNPLAALIPLIEAGNGKDANCSEVLGNTGSALREAETPVRKTRVKGVAKE
ncbi:MAG: AsmA family protein [Vicinamibacteria bacterium]